MDMTVRPQSKTLSFLYNNSLASFWCKHLQTHHLDLFTQVLTNTKQFPASGPFHKRPITHSPKVHTYHTRISIFFCSQFSSLVNFQGSIRETCFDASCPLTHILFSSKPGNLHSTLTWHLRDCDLWLWPRTLTGCCPVSGSVLSWFSLFATWDSGSLCQPVLGCVCFGCSSFVRGGLLSVVVPVEFFSSSIGLTTRLPPHIESRSSARDCKNLHRVHILQTARSPRHSLVRSISTRLSHRYVDAPLFDLCFAIPGTKTLDKTYQVVQGNTLKLSP